MIRYKKYQNRIKTSSNYKKWYARAVADETVGLDELSEHMAQHNTPYSKGCIKGVLRDMVDCIKEILLQGKNVKIVEEGWANENETPNVLIIRFLASCGEAFYGGVGNTLWIDNVKLIM